MVVPGETGAGTRDAPPDRAAEAPVSGLFHGPLKQILVSMVAAHHAGLWVNRFA